MAVMGVHTAMTDAGHGADGGAHDDPGVRDDVVVEQGAGDGDGHAELGQVHAPPRGARRRQQLEPENEQNRGGEIRELDDLILRHG
jgi:hypothetical protein